MDTLRELVGRVARAFYGPVHVVVLDCVSRRGVVRDDFLARYLHVSTREVNKMCAKLKEDRLLKVESRWELKDGRRVSRTFYAIDYKVFVDVVKWKLWSMSREVESRMANVRANQGYVCVLCLSEYTPYDAANLVDSTTGALRCPIDGMELQETEPDDDEGLFLRFMDQMRVLLGLLKRTDTLIIPQYNPESMQEAIEVADKAAFYRTQRDDLGLAGNGRSDLAYAGGGVLGDDGVGDIIVVLEDDRNTGDKSSGDEDDDGEEFVKPEEEGDVKPGVSSSTSAASTTSSTGGRGTSNRDASTSKTTTKANSLPVWHQYSTVNGARVVGSGGSRSSAATGSSRGGIAMSLGLAMGMGLGTTGGALPGTRSVGMGDKRTRKRRRREKMTDEVVPVKTEPGVAIKAEPGVTMKTEPGVERITGLHDKAADEESDSFDDDELSDVESSGEGGGPPVEDDHDELVEQPDPEAVKAVRSFYEPFIKKRKRGDTSEKGVANDTETDKTNEGISGSGASGLGASGVIPAVTGNVGPSDGKHEATAPRGAKRKRAEGDGADDDDGDSSSDDEDFSDIDTMRVSTASMSGGLPVIPGVVVDEDGEEFVLVE